MAPRHAADYRTVLWALLAPLFVGLQYARPDWIPYLWWLTAYFAIACGVIAHNHNHSPTFKNKRANRWFSHWLSLFWGYPLYAWIPTHNLNHHKFVNAPGDATITWRWTTRHNAFVAATYFFVSAYYQQAPTKEFLRRTRERNPVLYRQILMQYAFWGSGIVALLGVAVALHGVRTGLYVFLVTVVAPAFLSLWTVHLFNYEQHVRTDPWSEHDHSRNFVSPVLNFLLFNNGYHAAHHENPGLHWSRLPEAHAKIESAIHPNLKQKSLIWYWIKQYVVSPFYPAVSTVQIGRDPSMVAQEEADTSGAIGAPAATAD